MGSVEMCDLLVALKVILLEAGFRIHCFNM